MAFTKVTNAGIGSTNTVLLHNLNVVGTVTATDGIFSGIGSFGGNVSVGGVLTYEDVTNVDSVGLITARKGISVLGAGVTIAGGGLNVNAGVSTFGGNITVGSGITLSPDGDVYTTGVSTFSGDVSIADKIIHTDDTNTTIRFPQGNTVSIETAGVEALRVDSSRRVVIGATSQRSVWGGQQKVSIEGTDGPTSSVAIVRNSNDGSYPYLAFGKSRGTSDGSSTIVQDDDVTGLISFNGADGGDMNPQTAEIRSEVDGTPGVNDMPGRLLFLTTADGAYGAQERLRITSTGLVGIGEDNPTYNTEIKMSSTDAYSASTLNNGQHQLRVNNAGASGVAGILLTAEPSSGSAGHAGIRVIAPANGSADMTFSTRSAGTYGERLRIASDGKIGINNTSPTFAAGGGVHLKGSGTDFTTYRVTASSNTGVDFSQASDGKGYVYNRDNADLIIGTNNTERLRIDSVGTLLVAHSSQRDNFNSVSSTEHAPIIQLEGVNQKRAISITASGNNDGGILMLARQNGSVGENTVVSSGNQIGRVDFQASGGTNMEVAAQITAEVDGTPGDNDMPGRLLFKTTADGANSATERLRITSNGTFRFNTTSAYAAEKYNFYHNSSSDSDNCFTINNHNSYENIALLIRHGRGGLSGYSGSMIVFRGNDGTDEGSIVTAVSSTSYNTSSDYRLKENEVLISDGIARLKTLKPYRFNFKKDPGVKVDGFFAHEVADVVPQAVTGEKDAVDSNNKIIRQQLDYAKLTPLLTAALQEAITEIETLKTKVAALES